MSTVLMHRTSVNLIDCHIFSVVENLCYGPHGIKSSGIRSGKAMLSIIQSVFIVGSELPRCLWILK